MALTAYDLVLFVDDSGSSPLYRFEASATFSSPDIVYKANGNGEISSEPDENGVFHVELYLRLAEGAESPDNPTFHSVDLSDFPFSAENDEMELHLVDHLGGQLTSGTIKTEDAQHETRPWKPSPIV